MQAGMVLGTNTECRGRFQCSGIVHCSLHPAHCAYNYQMIEISLCSMSTTVPNCLPLYAFFNVDLYTFHRFHKIDLIHGISALICPHWKREIMEVPVKPLRWNTLDSSSSRSIVLGDTSRSYCVQGIGKFHSQSSSILPLEGKNLGCRSRCCPDLTLFPTMIMIHVSEVFHIVTSWPCSGSRSWTSIGYSRANSKYLAPLGVHIT